MSPELVEGSNGGDREDSRKATKSKNTKTQGGDKMKRFWALAIALTALAVWTVPALAEVKFGGEYRLRAESMSGTTFNDNSKNDNQAFYGQRVRLTGVATPADDTTVKITLQDTRTWGDSSAVSLTDTGANTVDLHESFLQINKFFGTPIGLKVGRQELVYGDQRLVGSFGWSNNGRSFDALKLMFSNDTVNVDAFTAKVDENNAAADESDNDEDFYGIYATIKSIPNNTLDVYALMNRDGETLSGNETKVMTYGARLAGKAVGLDYTVELPMQSGTMQVGATEYDVKAMAYAIKLGYTIPNNSLGLRVGAEYDYASGDDDAADTDIETFNQLYPTNHDKYGFMDQQGWKNMKAWNVNVSAKPTPKLGVRVDYWNFALAEEVDEWYSAGGTALGTLRTSGCTTTCDDQMGTEVDITLNYKYSDAVGIQAGVSRFMTGSGAEDRLQYATSTASAEDMDWMFVQLTANF